MESQEELLLVKKIQFGKIQFLDDHSKTTKNFWHPVQH